MNRSEPCPRTAWLFSILLRERDRQMILGDLVEEHALLLPSLGPAAAARWYRKQVLRSVAPVIVANIRRGTWLKTLGAMLAGYAVVATLVVAGDAAMSRLVMADETLYSLLSLAIGFPAMMLGGYLAAWMRPGAALALAIMAGVMGILSLAATGGAAPIWYQSALIVIGPLGALAGGRLRKRVSKP